MPTCTTFIQPLNLECIFINTFAEGIWIFLALFVILISYLAGRFRMNGFAFLSMLVLFALITYEQTSGLIMLLILVLGIMVYSIMKKLPQN